MGIAILRSKEQELTTEVEGLSVLPLVGDGVDGFSIPEPWGVGFGLTTGERVGFDVLVGVVGRFVLRNII